MDVSDLITPAHAAEEKSVVRTSVYRAMDRGTLPRFVIDGKLFTSRSAVTAWKPPYSTPGGRPKPRRKRKGE